MMVKDYMRKFNFKNLIDDNSYSLEQFKNDLFELTGIRPSDKDINSAVHNLNLLFITENQIKKYSQLVNYIIILM